MAWIIALSGSAHAGPGELTPYRTDARTLHLWHLDENGPPFPDAAKDGTPLLGLLNGAAPGQPSIPRLGNSISFNHDAGGTRGQLNFKGAILLAAPKLAAGDADNAPRSFRYQGADGAFTIEALLHFDVLPSKTGAVAMDVVTMDGEDKNRIFNFRVESAGFLAFIPLSVSGGALAAIPTTGAHAVNTTDWFHVAVTYDGNEASANNLKLYWTRLDAPQNTAHLIGRGTLAEDLGGLADFAIGNEGREMPNNSEAEPFRGRIDEVRISSVARDPSDYLFVPEASRRTSAGPGGAADSSPIDLRISSMFLDGRPVSMPVAKGKLSLPPGLHRLGFDFGIPAERIQGAVNLRCRLKGLDDRWIESGRGMTMTCEVLDERGDVLSLFQFPVLGASRGWQTSIEDSAMSPRSEPIQVPAGSKSLRITLSSGAEDTTGTFVVDDLNLLMPGGDGKRVALLGNAGFEKGTATDKPEGVPDGWARGKVGPEIARIEKSAFGPSLALVDGDLGTSGSWTGTVKLPPIAEGGVTMLLKWNEMFNVIAGSLHRATFANVPPGDYTFEAVAASPQSSSVGNHVELPFEIRPPVTSRPWFWALVAASVVGSLALGIVAQLRQKSARKLDRLRVVNALARDRARIARDMHDDLGTRITLMSMNASLAQRELDKSPESTKRHLGNLNSAARSLVTAMDDLVWAIDPKNDTLDHLGEHIVRLVEEVFRESEIRCEVDIPHVLPECTLYSDFRHHVSLAVKEALHNILKHAGPCEASVAMTVDHETLTITIRDTGRGFDVASPEAGNGLENLKHRMSDVGGTCLVDSAPGKGTRTVLTCPLPSSPPSEKPMS